MKKLFFVCLMAGCQSLFAQNINLGEIESLLSNKSEESIDSILLSKGFQKVNIQGGAPGMGLKARSGWRYPSLEIPAVTLLAHLTDTSGKSFYQLQTTNPFFYSHLMNQLSENNYGYRGTVPKEKEANLIFSNNKNEIIIRINSELQLPHHYQINIGKAVSDIGYFKPRKAVVARVGATKKTAPVGAVKKTIPKRKKKVTISTQY